MLLKGCMALAVAYTTLVYTYLVWLVFQELTADPVVQRIDFFVLLDSIQQLLQGGSLYDLSGRFTTLERPNLNHPAVVVALVPFGLMPATAAYAVWTAASFAALAATCLVLAPTTRPLPRPTWPLVVVAILTFPGMVASIHIGQLGIVLALGVAFLWRLVRSERWGAAGCVFGLLVVTKLFLLPLGYLFIREGARRGLAAAAGAVLAASALVLPVVGLSAYREWATTLATVDWYDHLLNASLIGLIDNAVGGTAPKWAPAAAAILVLGVAVAVTFRPPWPGTTRRERDFVVLLAAGILASPLGWLYYTPSLFPWAIYIRNAWPAFSPAARRIAVVAGALLWMPYAWQVFMPDTAWGAVLGGTYTYGMLLLILLAGMASLDSQRHAGGERSRELVQRSA